MSLLTRIISFQKKKHFKNFDAAINHVKHGVYHSIKKEFLKKHDDTYSGLMAAAVTNEIFALEATTKEARLFAAENKKNISDEISNIKNNPEIIRIINICLKLRAKVLFENISSGTSLTISSKAIENLKKNGLLIQNIELPTTKKFIKDARLFHKKAMNIVW